MVYLKQIVKLLLLYQKTIQVAVSFPSKNPGPLVVRVKFTCHFLFKSVDYRYNLPQLLHCFRSEQAKLCQSVNCLLNDIVSYDLFAQCCKS